MNKLFNQFKISTKLIILSSVLFLLSILIFFIASNNITRMRNMADKTFNTTITPLISLVDISIPYGNIRSSLREIALVDVSERAEIRDAFEENFRAISIGLNSYQEAVRESPEELAIIRELEDDFNNYMEVLRNRVVAPALAGRSQESLDGIPNLSVYGGRIREKMFTLTEINRNDSYQMMVQDEEITRNSFIIMTSIFVVSFIGAAVVAIFIIVTIKKQINNMLYVTKSISEGNLNININTTSKDELGTLSKSLSQVVIVLKGIIEALHEVAEAHKIGKISTRIDESNFKGSYQEIVSEVNQMFDRHIAVKKKTIKCITEIANGNFDAPMDVLPLEQNFINQGIDLLKNNLLRVDKEINMLVSSAIDGELSKRVNVEDYKGDWATILVGLNKLLDNVVFPINEAADVLSKVSEGDFKVTMKGDYKGDFLLIKTSLNNTLSFIGSYILEITEVLYELAKNNFNQEIKREYIGDFSSIKTSVNLIIDKLNNVLKDIHSAATEFDMGSNQVAQTSIGLAEGASQQSGHVEDLNGNLSKVAVQIQENAQNANRANDLSHISRANAKNGQDKMNELLSAMEIIRQSSTNINNIIKVIDGISFQTNLLALNAAVEAARAGVHGKGFSVVAEEVRNLANRSKKAASETTALIEDSVAKVTEGTDLAKNTAEALDLIVSSTSEVSDLIQDISTASSEQATSIDKITEVLKNISSVTQNNAAISEEAAASSEELSSQSQTLRSLVDAFKLK